LQRLAALRRGPGVDQIRGRFGLEQIELAVEHRPAGEFPRTCGPCPRRHERRHGFAGNEQAAVRRQLNQVLTGVGAGRGKAGDEHVVHGVARRRVHEPRA